MVTTAAQILNGLRWSAVVRLAAQATTWFITIIVMHLLTPGDYGLISLATIFLGFCALMVIEGPQDDARAAAIIAEVKNLALNKPIKYVVNTHHHFDHAGGLGAFAAEGATIITHDSNKAFLEQSLAAARTIQPDKLTQTGKKATVEGMQDKRVLSDATHIVELYRIQGTTHADGLIMAYLPKEKLLVEVDVYTPAPANATPPAQPNPASVNLYDNIERLKLVIDQILPLHGRKVPLAELQKSIGKAS
jgi:glyoxylase-like metal-dependent hydrolase (beta-lactamase superfamily II)